jgi:antitoxin component YwqK of YwqJK toxin-antitoxin module
MLKKILYLLTLVPFVGSAQFYYKDMVSMQQTTALQQTYKAQKIRKVILNSFDPGDQPSPNFICFQELTPTFNIIKTYTQSAASMQSVLVSQFNGNLQLIKSSDSSNASLAVTNYSYNDKGWLTELNITTQSYAYKQSETEKHVWLYDEKGQAEKMYRIRNSTDTVVVTFKCDETGLPIEEEWFNKNGKSTSLYYYYYENKRLTDIVKFNDRAKKLLPEYVFEYNPDGQLIQMLTVQPGSSNYLIWKYRYNEKGLKEKESCFDKQKSLLGYVTYRYQ